MTLQSMFTVDARQIVVVRLRCQGREVGIWVCFISGHRVGIFLVPGLVSPLVKLRLIWLSALLFYI